MNAEINERANATQGQSLTEESCRDGHEPLEEHCKRGDERERENKQTEGERERDTLWTVRHLGGASGDSTGLCSTV